MVTAPMCKICGERHWLSEPHRTKARAGDLSLDGHALPIKRGSMIAFQERDKPRIKLEPPLIASVEVGPIRPGETVSLERAPKRDRAAYMRGYRAALKVR